MTKHRTTRLPVIMDAGRVAEMLRGFGRFIEYHRDGQGMHRIDLARAAGMDVRRLARIEAGKEQATTLEAARLLEVLVEAEAKGLPPEPGAGYVSPGVRLRRNMERGQ